MSEYEDICEPENMYDWERFKRFAVFSGLVLGSVLAIGILYRTLFVALAISLIFSYVLSPAIARLGFHLHVKQPVIVLIMVVIFFGAFIGLMAAVLPTVYSELVAIIKQIPRAANYINQKMIPLRDWLGAKGVLSYEKFDEVLLNLDLTKKLTNTSTNALQQLWSTTPQVLGGAMNILLIPMLTWVQLSYWERIKGFFKYIVPPDIKPIAVYNLQKMDFILWGVVKGQLLVALILSFLYMLGFSIINLASGLAIGAVAGICRIVPYLDVVVGASLSVIVIISQGGGIAMIVAVAIVIVVVQALDGMFITPRVIGDKAGLHPVVVIASVVSFGDWFGIFGILFAVPAVAIVSSIVQMAIPYYLNSPFYKGPS